MGNIRAALLGVYAGNDTNVDRTIPAVEAQLQAAGRTYQINVYPDADHAFFNDTRPSYVEAAATAAWRDTLAWFAIYLRGAGLPATGDGDLPPDSDSTALSDDDANMEPPAEDGA